jgi:hypothetical protein
LGGGPVQHHRAQPSGQGKWAKCLTSQNYIDEAVHTGHFDEINAADAQGSSQIAAWKNDENQKIPWQKGKNQAAY